MPNYNTTRRMAYMGFVISVYLAVRGLEKNVNLTDLGVLVGMFILPTGFHAARKGFGKEKKNEPTGE